MALLLLAVVCVGTYAVDFTKVQKIDVTWPFCYSPGTDGSSIPYILSDYIVTNDTDDYPSGPVFENSHITLVTSGSPYTNISSGLTVVGTKDISSYTSKLTSWSDNDSTTFTTFGVNNTTSGTETIDLVITPNYPGYRILEDSVTFMAFKECNGGSHTINIATKILWKSGTMNQKASMDLSELPSSSLERNKYRSRETCLNETGWYNSGTYYGYSMGVGDIYQVQLYITGLQEGDKIYIGNVCVSFDVGVDVDYIDTSSMDGDYLTAFTSGSVVDEYIGSESIVHKAAKWYQDNIRYNNSYDGTDYVFNDDFDDENQMDTLENGVAVQAAHLYVDTIYMKKGSSIDLLVPGIQSNGSDCSINNYFRWFNYRNDKNFYCGDDKTVGSDDRKDLLIPVKISGDITAYRFANGYVSGLLSNRSTDYNTNGTSDAELQKTLRKVSFYYPTDDEYETLGALDNFKGKDVASLDNKYYAVACDLSIYNDFCNDTYVADAGGIDFGLTDDATGKSTEQIYCEPTLTQRVLFYIIGIDSNTSESNLPEDFKHYGNLFTNTDYQGGTNESGEKYLEEYEITFPSKRISNHTNELVALSKDAQAYALPGEDDPTTTSLDIKFASDDNTNNFSLTSNNISGAKRVIQFYQGTSGAQWSVDNNSTATILVTKTVSGKTYNIARFKLTFKDYAIPLTEPQVAVLDTLNDSKQYWWGNMSYRAQSYMNENYDLVNSLWFDYGSYADTYNSHKIFNKASNNAQWPGQYQNYPFPLKWSNSSYGFYDGSYDVTPEAGTSTSTNTEGNFLFKTDNYRLQTWFCMYNIVSDYMGWGELNGYISPNIPQYSTVKNSGGSWLYVDASDRPGTVAELEFEEKLCKGSEVIATAWIKSAGRNDSSSDDAAVMFTIMGVTKNDDGTETHTPIYRQYSGQIRTTAYIDALSEESSLLSSETGKGSGTNEWFQLYMQFVNQDDVDYDYYTLRIDNCCASTDGGDYYLDEISVYVLHPTVDVAQIEPVCTDDDDEETNGYTPIRLDIDYESLMGCFGLDPDDYDSKENDDVRSLDFIIINKYKYESYLKEHPEDVKEAIMNSIATLYYKVATTSTDANGETVDTISTKTSYPTLSFHLYYDGNTPYDEEKMGENYLFDGFLYGRTSGSTEMRELVADFYSDLSAYTPYMIILQVHNDDSGNEDESESDEKKLDSFADWLANSYNCAIKADFYLTSTTKIKLNGQVVDPTETLCKDQVVHVEPVGTYVTTGEDDDGEVTHIIEGECFDWFIGYEEEFVAPNENYGGVSLKSSLSDFRTVYPKATTLANSYSTYAEDENNRIISEDEDNTDPVTGEAETVVDTVFTKYDYEILQYYLDAGRLALCQTYLDVHVPDTGITLVIQPIKIEDMVVEGSETTICFGYVPLVLSIDGVAPSLNMGFSDVAYPENYTPCLRLGLEQFKNATVDHPITVNLRGATYVEEEEDESDGDGNSGDGVESVKAYKGSKTKKNVAAKRVESQGDEGDEGDEVDEDEITDHLGKVETIETDSVDYGVLYLIGTNDTAYSKTIAADNFGSYELAVGEIKRLYANENSEESDPDADETDEVYGIGSYMQIYFYTNIGDSIEGVPFEPKEGCYYSMTVHFEEKNADGETISLPCYGSFPLIVKVVPEYLVWQGTSDSYNWNDDSNWKRADSCDIQKVDDSTWIYLTNEQNTTDGGYVPMLFTKVVLPKGSKAQLYSAGYEEDADTYTWEEDTPDEIYPMTENIEYDMMVYDESSGDGESATTQLTTKHYRVNLCDEIHLEDGAQLLHAELLMYNKAWIDVSIPKSKWTLVSLPLNEIYAGDWYTKQSGRETSEYFTDLTFEGDTAIRSNPLVYQRSWDSNARIIDITDTDDDVSVKDTLVSSISSYASTGWSSVYNDGAAQYSPGSGFSVKAYTQNPDVDSVLFRFPKYDVKYTTTYSDTLSKENYGKLWLSDMVSRLVTDPNGDTYAELDTLKMSTTPTAEGYCLIGNPFTASMSLAKFLEVNNDCISSYWFEDNKGTDGPIAGTGTSTSDGASDKLLPPYSAFFVQVDETLVDSLIENGLTVMFTADMQSDTLITIDEDAEVFSIRAVSASGRSSTAFGYSDKATDGYSTREDAVLLEDDSWKRSGMPLVYTVAGSKAVSVNTLKEQRVIPLGVFADEGISYTLTFVGVNNVEEPVLYDAELNTETPINEGMSMTLQGATHGRYFIRTAGNTTEIQEVTKQTASVSVYSPASRTIVVSADEEIERVEVYDIGGRMLKRATVNGSACTITDVNCGIAVVKVKTESGLHVTKLRIKN